MKRMALGAILCVFALACAMAGASSAKVASYSCTNRIEGHDGYYTNSNVSAYGVSASFNAVGGTLCDSNTNPTTNRNFVQIKIGDQGNSFVGSGTIRRWNMTTRLYTEAQYANSDYFLQVGTATVQPNDNIVANDAPCGQQGNQICVVPSVSDNGAQSLSQQGVLITNEALRITFWEESDYTSSDVPGTPTDKTSMSIGQYPSESSNSEAPFPCGLNVAQSSQKWTYAHSSCNSLQLWTAVE